MSVIIIGGGPAGISAALYTIRAGVETTIITMKNTALNKAEKIDNYYGTPGVTGIELFEIGIKQAKDLGVQFVEEEVVGMGFGESLYVATSKGEYPASSIIIATGTSRNTPKIQGIKELEGKGISYCAVCDGFFFRGKDLGVLGSGEYAVHEALALKPMAKSVTIFTNGRELEGELPEGVEINKEKIEKISGETSVSGVVTEVETVAVEGLFIAEGIAGSSDLAKKIGIVTEGTKVVVNENMETNVPGIYAVGDCTGGLLQVSKAVYEGAKAGTEAIKFLRKK